VTLSLVLLCLWVVVAAIASALPQRFHWRAAGGLIVLALPLLPYVAWQNGPWTGLIALAVALSVLRWPAFRLLQRVGLFRPDKTGT
jgi:hypothetical protein